LLGQKLHSSLHPSGIYCLDKIKDFESQLKFLTYQCFNKNFLTLITRFLPTHFTMGGGNAKYLMSDVKCYSDVVFFIVKV
jgi:hypothetical protein